MLSGLPPPFGGVNVWTQSFMQMAPAYGIDIQLQRVGSVTAADTLSWGSRLARFNRGFVQPALAIAYGTACRADILHICTSGGLGFWRSLALASERLARQQACVIHLHSRVSTCSDLSLRWAARLATSPRLRLVTPSRQDAARWQWLFALDNLVPMQNDATGAWHGPSPGSVLRLVFIGWMIREKGLFELLDGVAATPHARLDAYGPNVRPADLAAWQARIKALGLGGRVRYVGVLEHTRVAATISGYDALVLPSHNESFALAVAEAMLLGVPVIATRVGMLWDAPDDCFLAFSQLDPTVMAATLTRASKAALARLGPTGRDYAMTRLAPHPIMQGWRAIYEALQQARRH